MSKNIIFEDEDFNEYYSESGEYLKEMFKLQDFLNCKETNEILRKQHEENYYKNFEPKIIDFMDNLINIERSEDTSVFIKNDAHCKGELINLLFHHIKQKNDLTIFYKNPELAEKLKQ
jgi:hypothetical protein